MENTKMANVVVFSRCMSRERLQDLHDGGGLGAAEEVEQVHLRQCDACAARLADMLLFDVFLAEALNDNEEPPRGKGRAA